MVRTLFVSSPALLFHVIIQETDVIEVVFFYFVVDADANSLEHSVEYLDLTLVSNRWEMDTSATFKAVNNVVPFV